MNQYFTVSGTCLTNVFSKKGVFCKRKVGERHSTRPSHGNSKSGESYTRTHPAKIRNAAAQVGEKNGIANIDDICKENSPTTLKTAKQVQDRLYYEKKKQTATKTSVPRKNLTDDVICILGELNDHDFFQEVILSKNRPSLVILYNEDQIKNHESELCM